MRSLLAGSVFSPLLLLLLAASPNDESLRRIEAAWKPAEAMANANVPGVSVAVVRDSKLAWAKGYGVKRSGGKESVDANIMFQAASISKPVAAMAAMHMSQYGNFSLDEDVNGKMKSWKVPENAFTSDAKVTLRGLLSHSAGLTVHGFRGYGQGEGVPTTIQVLNGTPPANSKPVVVDTKPGTAFRYSGGGYTVLQQLMMDRMNGKSFPEIMAMTVLNKLGMRDSTYEQPLPPKFAVQAAHGHKKEGTVVPGEWHTYPEMAAAGLWTTPSDLAKVMIEMQKAARGESNQVIEKNTALEMLRVQKGDYGLGWGIAGPQEFTHGGSNEGFRCLLYSSGRDGVIVMTNADRGFDVIRPIVKAVSVEYGWPAPKI
jgi:CubicO group peptidase (beta-lactamase class C family)